MYILIVKLLPLLIGIIIAYAIACVGKRKHIGIGWSLYFGLLHPILALIIVLFSKKKDTSIKKVSVFWKILAVFLGIFGIMMFTNGLRTNKDTAISRDILQERQSQISPINTGNKSFDLIMTDSSKTFGGVLGGGILCLVPSVDVIAGNDYRLKRYNYFYFGLLLISISCYILKQRNQNFQIKNAEYSGDTNSQKNNSSMNLIN